MNYSYNLKTIKTMKNNLIYQLLKWDIVNMSNIQRYSWATVIKQENLAEHSYYVTVLSDLIAEDIEEKYPQKELDRGNILRYALYHDYEEVYTWDIVTPVKYKSEEVKEWLEKLWKILLREWVESNFKWNSHIAKRIKSSTFEYESKKDKDLENRIVKFADILQSLIYIIREINLWNIYTEPILKRIISTLIKKYWPTNYFRSYVEDLLKILEEEKLLKWNLLQIDWEEFKNLDPKLKKLKI